MWTSTSNLSITLRNKPTPCSNSIMASCTLKSSKQFTLINRTSRNHSISLSNWSRIVLLSRNFIFLRNSETVISLKGHPWAVPHLAEEINLWTFKEKEENKENIFVYTKHLIAFLVRCRWCVQRSFVDKNMILQFLMTLVINREGFEVNLYKAGTAGRWKRKIQLNHVQHHLVFMINCRTQPLRNIVLVSFCSLLRPILPFHISTRFQ